MVDCVSVRLCDGGHGGGIECVLEARLEVADVSYKDEVHLFLHVERSSSLGTRAVEHRNKSNIELISEDI